MSEPDVPRRMRLVAVGAAFVAVVFALVAVIVVVTRDGGSAETKPQASEAPALSDHVVPAADVVKLQRNDVEVVIEKGTTKGLRVKDAALAKALGLEDGDVITAISGKPMTREFDAYEIVLKLSMMSATTMYVEILRADAPVLLRWKLDGDLRQARYGAIDSLRGSGGGGGSLGGSGSFGSIGGSYTGGTSGTGGLGLNLRGATPTDPLLDTIEKIDDFTYHVPRKTAEALFGDPMKLMTRGARVVPSLKNGQPNGLKLYAIRPSSPFARVGLQNGDTVHAVNGFDLSETDALVDAYVKLKDASVFELEITRRGRPVSIIIKITR